MQHCGRFQWAMWQLGHEIHCDIIIIGKPPKGQTIAWLTEKIPQWHVLVVLSGNNL